MFAGFCFAANLKPGERLQKERFELYGEAGKRSETGMCWGAVGGPEGRNPLGCATEGCPVLSPALEVWMMCPEGATKEGSNACAVRVCTAEPPPTALSFSHTASLLRLSSAGVEATVINIFAAPLR